MTINIDYIKQNTETQKQNDAIQQQKSENENNQNNDITIAQNIDKTQETQQEIKQQPIKKSHRFGFGTTKPLGLALIVGAFQVLYALATSSTNNLMVLIVQQLGATQAQCSWLANAELLAVITAISFTSKLCEKFGMTYIFTTGSIIFAIFNILFCFKFVYTNLAFALICKIFDGFGCGLCLPTAIPLSTYLVDKKDLPAIVSTISFLLPIGLLIASLVSGFVGEHLGYQWMYVFAGILAVIDLIFQLFKFPYKNFPRNKNVKIDWIGSILMSLGVILLILGLSALSGTMPIYLAIILLVVGILVCIFFFYYNFKLSKCPIFNQQVFNQSTILNVLPLLIGSIALYGEKYVLPYTLKVLCNISVSKSGIYLAITSISTFLFSPVFNILNKKIISKRVALIGSIIFFVFEGLSTIQTLIEPIPALLTLYSFMSQGAYIALVITCQSANMQSCPKQLTQQVGILNQICQNIGHAFGIAISLLCVTNFDTEITKKSNGLDMLVITIFTVIMLIITFFMGVFGYERGKKGFKESMLQRTKTFQQSYQQDYELIEKEEFSGDEQQTRAEKLMQLFNVVSM